jgi:hypothetical protein
LPLSLSSGAGHPRRFPFGTKIQAAEQLAENDADRTAVEFAERVNGLEQAARERRPALASGISQWIEPLICPGG